VKRIGQSSLWGVLIGYCWFDRQTLEVAYVSKLAQ
jgi:hypothetical protein